MAAHEQPVLEPGAVRGFDSRDEVFQSACPPPPAPLLPRSPPVSVMTRRVGSAFPQPWAQSFTPSLVPGGQGKFFNSASLGPLLRAGPAPASVVVLKTRRFVHSVLP